MRSPCLLMFVGAVMTLYSQQACATLHWRMRKTAGSPACQGPDSFLSSYGPITLFITDAQATAIPLPMEPLVCHIWTVKKMQSWIPDAAIWFSSCLRVPVLWDLFIQISNSWVKRRGKNVNRLITLHLLYSHCTLQLWVELNDANEEYFIHIYVCLLPIISFYWLKTLNIFQKTYFHKCPSLN